MCQSVSTCLCRTFSRPGVNPVSVFCVATGISSLSLAGRVSPLDRAEKYLIEQQTFKRNNNCTLPWPLSMLSNWVVTRPLSYHLNHKSWALLVVQSHPGRLGCTYAADHCSMSWGWVLIAALVNCLRMSGSSGGMLICCSQYIVSGGGIAGKYSGFEMLFIVFKM